MLLLLPILLQPINLSPQHTSSHHLRVNIASIMRLEFGMILQTAPLLPPLREPRRVRSAAPPSPSILNLRHDSQHTPRPCNAINTAAATNRPPIFLFVLSRIAPPTERGLGLNTTGGLCSLAIGIQGLWLRV